MNTIAIINGPNLNLVGVREPEVYGTRSLDQYLDHLRAKYSGVELLHVQSNIEGELVDAIQRYGFSAQGLVINAGGYSHTSVALRDALLGVPAPAVEVHISNIFAREEYRHHSLITSACRGMVCGLDLEGYDLAIDWLLHNLQK
ncbi:MAG: 3-dehydroquinate dehydratase [Bacteroidales bacterium]|nr:3-dehydroquinate dehydratase [Bacteroidales bacterium]